MSGAGKHAIGLDWSAADHGAIVWVGTAFDEE
jgi:hypothetical protein